MTNLAQASLIKCYWMLQNASVTAFNVSELRENQQGDEILIQKNRLGLIPWLQSSTISFADTWFPFNVKGFLVS